MALSTQDPHMTFICEQFDSLSQLRRQFALSYYYDDGSIAMVECRPPRVYLKREATNFTRSAFHIGAVLIIHGKATTIVDYADEVTRRLCKESGEKTTVIVAEDAFAALGRYVAIFTEECGFVVADAQMTWVRQSTVQSYDLPSQLASRRVVVLCGVRNGAIAKGFDFVERCPGTCTAKDAAQAARWANLCVAAREAPLAALNEINSSIVVFKPDLLTKQKIGTALQLLLDARLDLTALSQMTLTASTATDFLRPYKGVLPDVAATARSLTGNVWVLQFVSADDTVDVVSTVRAVCGPFDPVVARKLYPRSIRGRFGVDHAYNGVHCCDLPTDGPVYADYFFKR